jgi:hypothetical protein
MSRQTKCKEKIDMAHEIHLHFGGEGFFKVVLFHIWVRRKVDEIINKQGNIDGSFTRDQCAHKETTVM